MRKRRAILFDDDPILLDMLKMYFEMRGYDVIACRAPVRCPVYEHDGRCENLSPCGDIMLSDYRMSKMTGVELLQEQARMGCKLASRNKAIISGYLEPEALDAIRELGCAFFQKPFLLDELDGWILACEQRMDLSRPLGFKRKELRHACCIDASLTAGEGAAVCSAAIVNRSDDGICVKIDRPLTRDEVVDLQVDPTAAPGRFLVRWTTPVPGNGFLAGLSCC